MLDDLDKRIIDNQDIIVFYSLYDNFYGLNGLSKIKIFEDDELDYRKLSDFFNEKREILDYFSTQNLITILNSIIIPREPNKNTYVGTKLYERALREYENKKDFFEYVKSKINLRLQDVEDYAIYAAEQSTFIGSINSREIFFRRFSDKMSELTKKFEFSLSQMQNEEYKDFIKEYYNKGKGVLGISFLKNINIFKSNHDKFELLKAIIDENPNIIKSINLEIFRDEIYSLGEDFVKYISKFPNLSTEIVLLLKNNEQLFNIFHNVVNTYKDKPVFERSIIIEATIKYLTRMSMQHDINEKMSNATIEDIVNCALLYQKLEIESDEFNISNFLSQIANPREFKDEFERMCMEIYNTTKDEYKYTLAIGLDIKKSALLYMKFGMSLQDAKKMINMYDDGFDGIKKQFSKKHYIKLIKQIIECDDEDQLSKFIDKHVQFTALESLERETEIKQLYSKTYIDKTRRTYKNLQPIQARTDDLQSGVLGELMRVDVEVFKLPKEFGVVIRSTDTGFKGDKELIDNSHRRTFEVTDSPSNHLLAGVYNNEANFGVTPLGKNGVYLAFFNIPDDGLNILSNLDADSNINGHGSTGNKEKWYSEQKIYEYQHGVYSEATIETQPPDAILIFNDASQQIINNTIQAAREFGVPIIYVDKREIIRNQLDTLKNLRKEFKKVQGNDKKMNIIKQLVYTYEANVSGWLLNRIKNESEKETLTSSIDNSNLGEEVDELIEYKKEIESLINSYAITLDRKDDTIDWLERLEIMYQFANERGKSTGFAQLGPMINVRKLIMAASGLMGINPLQK